MGIVSVGLQWTSRKIGKIFTLYQRELFKKIPRLCTFCTQSVKEGLKCFLLCYVQDDSQFRKQWKNTNILLQKGVCYDAMRNCPVDYGAVRNWSMWYVMVPCIIHLDISHHGNSTATSWSLPRPNSSNGSVLRQIYGSLNLSFVFH